MGLRKAARRRTISVKRPEWRKLPAGLMAAPPADSRRRRVVRELPNSDLPLKSVSACHSIAAKPMARAMPRLRPPAQQKIPAWRWHMRPPVSCSPDRQPLILSRVRWATARCLYFYRSRRNWSALCFLHRARPSVFSLAHPPAFVRNCLRAGRDRLRPGQSRRKAQTTGRRRPTSKTAPVIEIVRGWPFQFTNFKDSTRRGSRTGKSEVFPTMRK